MGYKMAGSRRETSLRSPMEWPASASQPSAIKLSALVLSALVTLDVLRRFIRNRIKRQGLPLPPGPTPLPVLGSALSINAQEPWLTYTAWRAKYGEWGAGPWWFFLKVVRRRDVRPTAGLGRDHLKLSLRCNRAA